MPLKQYMRKQQLGLSLVELMVGLVIGLVTTLVIMQIFSTFEGQKRSTMGSADAQTNGSIALFTIQRDLQMAGFGLPVFNKQNPPLKCNPTVTVDHDGNAATPAIDMFPISITDGGGGLSDVIQIRYSEDGPNSKAGVAIAVDSLLGSNAIVENNLGCNGGIAFDVQAVCSGFLYALGVADSMLRTGMAKRAVVIGAETFSRILDWEDRGTCVLFGDGAGAVVLEAQDTDEAAGAGILSTRLHADGAHNQLLFVDGGISTTGTVGKLRMKGREVFRHAVTNLASVLGEVLDDVGLAPTDIDWLVPHQANARILEATARKLNLPAEKVIMTVASHANTSAASVPLALDAGVRDGRIKPGQLVMLEAMGGGFTWGASLIRI